MSQTDPRPRFDLRTRATSFAGALALLACAASAQSYWSQVMTSQAPSVRSRGGMAYDFLRQRIVLFGGLGQQYSQLNDTWEFDGSTWKQIVTTKAPPGRSEFAMAYDRSRGVVVVHGGYGGYADTWEYDGVNWTERKFTTNPPQMRSPSMTYDAGTGTILLFGSTSFSSSSQETWRYEGYSWTRLSPASSPSAREKAVLVHDPIKNRVVLHGGVISSGFPQNDTWEWTGSTWTMLSKLSVNPATDLPASCYDGYRGRLVHFGGLGYSYSQDTHEWDGTKWELRTSVGPSARMGAMMAYDSVRRECVLFGGESNFSSTQFADTYRYVPLLPATSTKYAAGCAGTWSTPSLSTYGYDLPWVGSSMRMYLSALPSDRPAMLWLGASKGQSGGVPLPFPLAVLGMPGCSLVASLDLTLPVPTAGHYGTLPLNIPNDKVLAGQRLFSQAAIVDPGANAAGLIVTQGLELALGLK